MLATTRNSVDRMQRIIAGLRSPDIDDGEQQQTFDVSKFLTSRQQQSGAADTLVHYTIPQTPIWGSGDVDALETALTHLEQNAIEAAGGADGQVAIRLKQNASWAEIEVSDSGPGMSETFIQKELFTPFRSTKGLTGMGIGAYQARDRIRKYGGDLQVESTVGVGTTFTIKLPLRSAPSEQTTENSDGTL